MKSTLRFLGGAGTVTGSKHLLSTGGTNVLLDCGLFQGLKALRLRNWSDLPFDPKAVDAVVLSHAHLDHSGFLPVLVRKGYRGPIYCTPGTADLLRILLRDAAKLQEEEAAAANRYGSSKHHPAMPLYSASDAEAIFALLQRRPNYAAFEAARGVEVTFQRAGHILGAASVGVRIGGDRLLYSGDLGRWNRPILHDPDIPTDADIVLIEGTYGDRVHSPDAVDALTAVVRGAAERGGALLIPAFAVGRAQELLWMLRELEASGRIPELPVFLDSPMAIDVCDLYLRHSDEHDLEMRALISERQSPFATRRFRWVRSAAESRRLNEIEGAFIVIAGSGMATGGRILHHLRRRVADERTTVLFPGFQAAGTRGRSMQEGAATIRIFAEDIPVRAKVALIDGLSAHGDQNDLLRWLSFLRRAPRALWIVHAEAAPAERLREAIARRFGWEARTAPDGGIAEIAA